MSESRLRRIYGVAVSCFKVIGLRVNGEVGAAKIISSFFSYGLEMILVLWYGFLIKLILTRKFSIVCITFWLFLTLSLIGNCG